jgi:hypothetical protein
MTNNKQQTAVEWLQSIELQRDLTLADWGKAKEMEKQQKRIKLPSDEEIDEKAFQVPYDNTKDFYNLQFIKGAKWMRDKIQGGE